MKKKSKVELIVLIFSLMFLIQPVSPLPAIKTENSQTNAGIINGVIWVYNENKDRVSTASVDLADSAAVEKTQTNVKNINTDMNIITGITEVDSYYDRYVKFVMKDGVTSPYKQEKGLGLKGTVGNKTGNVDNILTAATNTFYRYDWASKYIFSFDKSKLLGQAILGLAGGPLKLYTNNIYVGSALTSSWFTTNVTVSVIDNVSIPMIDIFQQKYGEIIVPEINITYLFDQNETPTDLSDDQVTLIEHLVPEYQLIAVKTQSVNVNVKQTAETKVSLQGSYNLTGQYSETTTGNEVLISDANNFVFGWYGLESTVVSYNQSGGFTIQGNLQWNVKNEITFAGNGSAVKEQNRMVWWRSSNMSFNGLWSHKFSETGILTGKGALQSIIEAIRTRASTTTEDQLLIWANIIPSTMFAYSDTDNSGDASVRLNGSTLEILDTIMAVGLVQGVNLQQTYNYANHVNAQSFWQLGTDVLNNASADISDQDVKTLDETWGADPNSADFSATTVDFNWVTPVENNGKIEFNWGIMYNNFPTTWAITDGITEITNHIEPMDIGYNYTLTVDPAKGEAVLSNTYSNSGFTNTTLKTMADQLSFATYKHDLFLGMQKATDGADSTEGVNQGNLTTSLGSTEVVDQLFGGTKQQYDLAGGSSFNSQTTIVNLITGTGTSGEPESVNVSTFAPFASSWFGKKVGLSLLKWSADNRTKNSGIDWQFRENLVITAYPTWKGQGIVHDPTYSAVYAPRTVTITSGTETITSTISKTNTSTSAPWNLNATLSAIVVGFSIIKLKYKRRNDK